MRNTITSGFRTTRTTEPPSAASHLCGTIPHRSETDGRGDSAGFELVHCPRCRNLVIATGEPVCTACQEDGDEP